MTDAETKMCGRCKEEKALSEANFYPARPTATHPKGGWQSHCKVCWKVINKANREIRKARFTV